MAFTALRKPQLRVQAQKSRSYGNEPAHHDHGHDHHHVSYQHLHRPAITPDTFQLFSAKSEEEVPELKKETLMKNHGHLVAKGAHPEVCWSQQVFQSPSVLACISELFGTEFWFDKHDSATLLPAYQVQLRCFEEIKVPELQAEGISQVTIDLLHEIYIMRAHLCASEIDSQFDLKPTWTDRLNIFKNKNATMDRNYGMRHMSDGSMWFEEPLVESRQKERALADGRPGLFYKPFSFQESFQAHNQVNDGKGFKNNFEWAEHNIKTFKQLQGLITAIDRGLTDAEKDKMIAKLKNFKSQIIVDPAFEHQMNLALSDLLASKQAGDSAAVKQKIKSYYEEFCDTSRNGTNAVHARQTFDLAMQDSVAQPEASNDQTNDGLYLREGIDYFNGEGQRLAVFNELMSWFKFKVAKAHHGVMTNPTASPETKTMSERLKAATDYFVSPSIQKDLELMKLLRNANFSFKQKEDFLNMFSNGTESNVPDHVIRNILHPHKVTVALLGNKLKMLLKSEKVEYTQFFTDGSDSMFLKDCEALPSRSQVVNDEMHSENRLVSPVIDRTSDFPTGQSHVHHIKLNKLFFDYYGIDRTTEEGMAIIDQIVHTYDISPGEVSLDRAQAIPMPEHTFDELPLLKYDGYEYSDVEPEPDRTVENFDVSQIEHTMNLFLDELNKATKGKEPITLSKFKEANRLTTDQYSVLRSVLNLEKTEPRRIALMRKIWGTVLPDSELERLFHDQESKFHENHH